MNTQLATLAEQWLRMDQNPETHAAVQALVDASLRARMAPGFACMNDLTVLQASQGLCDYVLRTIDQAATKGIVIGHDHRHHSESFARLTASAFLHRGVRVYYYHDLVHTPLVPFGVKYLKAACGVMITASHNPKDDNGYKVYWDNACQIIPPHDKGIAEAINQNLEPWLWNKTLVDTAASTLCSDPIEEVSNAYYDSLTSLICDRTANATCSVRFAYTAMHGVGEPFARRAFETFGLPAYASVEVQRKPDPDFPTVAFPNPEERGALDVAQAVANEMHATVILANDPDADRFTAIERQASGEWRTFSGNELGVIFAEALFQDHVKRHTSNHHMLARMSKIEGFRVEECLTGFKWIGNRALSLRSEGYTVPFAYEEAIGYMIGDTVPDKDGVSALVYFAQLTARLYAANKTIGGHLNGLYEKYGHFRSNNAYVKCYDPVTIRTLFDRIRFGETPQPATANEHSGYAYALHYPKTIANAKVAYIRDLTIGYDSSQPDGRPTLPVSSSAQMITFQLENGCSITLRTSGTEPKIKWYIEHYGPDPQSVTQELEQIVNAVVENLLEPERNQLVR
ncbi:hypothetical protein BDF19DRAFT_484580 [Syncephalis fuscata]|nr:hypothetical protein BDF19DRAFT_484580 [Syncephalis fuscata]